MQRKPGFPVANCSIKMPDSLGISETGVYDEDVEQQQGRQQLINFGHSQWGFNNWNWAVTKQELDFVELTHGKYCAGVVAFVSVSVKSFDIHRENIGYATSNASTKGLAIYKSRKCAVTNALRETLLSFGGSVASELMELLDGHDTRSLKGEPPKPAPAPVPAAAPTVAPVSENNQNLANKPVEPKNFHHHNSANKHGRKDHENNASNVRSPLPAPVKNAAAHAPLKEPPGGKPQPVAANLPPAANRLPLPRPPPPAPLPAPLPRPSSNEAKLEGMTEEEARAERKRRQRMAQEEFRLKQLMKNGTDDKQELNRNSSSFDKLLLDIPTQDIVIEETGDSEQGARIDGKRKSPLPGGNGSKRRASATRLDLVQTD